jgi:hypothetical protein
MGTSTFPPVQAVLVTRDHQQIPITVPLPAPPSFTIHRADGSDQFFSLERTSLSKAEFIYVEDVTCEGQPAVFLPLCPVCGGQTETVRDINQPAIYACRDCETGVIVPTTAWSIARAKRHAKWKAK